MTGHGDDIGAPCDVAAERAVIAGVLAAGTYTSQDSNAAAFRAFEDATQAGLTAGMFWRPEHETVWRAITSLVESGAPVDVPSVVGALTRSGDLARVGGHVGVFALSEDAPAVSSVGYHARTVREYAASRALVAAGDRIRALGWATNSDASMRAAAALAEVEAAAATAQPAQDPSWSTLTGIWPAMVEETRRRMDPTAPDDGILWGLPSIDADCAPMRPGDLVVITGYSGGGKSVVVCNLAFDASQRQGKRALVHALEMSRVEVGQRWASRLHRVNLGRVVRGQLHPEERQMVEETHLMTVHGDALVVDDSAHLSLAQLRASVRAHKPEVVVVDQLPLMTPPDLRVSREQQMTALAYGLKQLAKDEHVVVVVASQLNADAMKRKVQEPSLHDLRESKAIAHAANWVIALHDPANGDEFHERNGELDWIVLKARQGRNNLKIPLAKQYVYATLAELS